MPTRTARSAPSRRSAHSAQPPHSKYERLIARAKEVPPATTSSCIPATRPRCAAPSRRRKPASSFRSWSGRPRRSPRWPASTASRSIASRSSTCRTARRPRRKAVELIREAKGELLMKGSLHTDELMREVTSSKTGLRTARRISHVFIMDVPTYAETLFITDAAINIFPDLDAKRDIIQNAIDLFTQVGLGTPRVAILSAVETVTSKIPSTIEAAALCKMADRGQITGGMLDGPLAFDNAIDPEAARIKGIKSEVAGRAQILVVPDLEAGNMLAKNLTFLAKADAAGIVLGARVPIILTSRADSVRARMASCAVAVLYADARRAYRARCRRRDRHGHDPRRQCRLVERQVPGVRASMARGDAEAPDQGPDRRHRHAAAAARRGADGTPLIDQTYRARAKCPTFRRRLRAAGAWLRETQSFSRVAVGHRVVHGGPDYDRPVLIDDERARAISNATFRWRRCTSRTISRRSARCSHARPELPQVACFDTAFHRGHSAVADHYAIPERFYAEGVRRYGFHGLSYEYIAERLREVAPEHRGRPRDRRPSRQRRLDVRAGRRPQRRKHDGLHRARRAADGHAAGPDRSRRRALSARPERHERRGGPGPALPRERPQGPFRHQQRHARASSEPRSRARSSRSTISSIASGCMPGCWRPRSAGSTPSCSPPASARTRRRSAPASPRSSPGSAPSSIRPPMPPARAADLDAGEPRRAPTSCRPTRN